MFICVWNKTLIRVRKAHLELVLEELKWLPSDHVQHGHVNLNADLVFMSIIPYQHFNLC